MENKNNCNSMTPEEFLKQVSKGKQMGKVKFPKQDTNALTKSVVQLFNSKGYFVWRQNNGAVWDEKNKIYRKGSVMKGVPDVIGFHKKTSRFTCIEIKTGNDKLSPYQNEFLKEVVAAGGLAFVVHSVDELLQLQNQI